MSSANGKGLVYLNMLCHQRAVKDLHYVNADITVNHVATRASIKRATHFEQRKKEIIYSVSAVTRDNDKGHLQPLIRGEEKEFVIVDTVT